jgi:hypothetical protein
MQVYQSTYEGKMKIIGSINTVAAAICGFCFGNLLQGNLHGKIMAGNSLIISAFRH